MESEWSMVLSDSEIKALIESKELIIHPILEADQIHCAKVDVRLDNVIYAVRGMDRASFNASFDDPREYTEIKRIPYNHTFVVHPYSFVTAPIFEMIKLPRYLVGRMDGRSSLARLGIIVHATASGIDPSYAGKLVCELTNLGTVPVELLPLTRIASISFDKIEGKVLTDYQESHGKYGVRIESAMSTDTDRQKIHDMVERL